jgi:hypothetical protein
MRQKREEKKSRGKENNDKEERGIILVFDSVLYFIIAYYICYVFILL